MAVIIQTCFRKGNIAHKDTGHRTPFILGATIQELGKACIGQVTPILRILPRTPRLQNWARTPVPGRQEPGTSCPPLPGASLLMDPDVPCSSKLLNLSSLFLGVHHHFPLAWLEPSPSFRPCSRPWTAPFLPFCSPDGYSPYLSPTD